MNFQDLMTTQDVFDLRKNYIDHRWKESPENENNAAEKILNGFGEEALFFFAKKAFPSNISHQFDALKILLGSLSMAEKETQKPKFSGGFYHVYLKTEIYAYRHHFELEESEEFEASTFFQQDHIRPRVATGDLKFLERRYLENIEEFKKVIAEIRSFPYSKDHAIEEFKDSKGRPVKLHKTLDIKDVSAKETLRQAHIPTLEKFLNGIFYLFSRENSPARNFLLSYIKQIYLNLSGGSMYAKMIKSFQESFDDNILPSALPSANTLNHLLRLGYTVQIATMGKTTIYDQESVISGDPEVQAWLDRFPLFKEDSKNVLYHRSGSNLNKRPEYLAFSMQYRKPIVKVGISPPEDSTAPQKRKRK